ncbi:response regulator transcription factor [Hymenobacter sp. RP-2-7]|uniref:Response regulator transcription factor n=1 Tax=Hymenobacter polaris TaxID=2682546 RepID=A0A7Y0AH49_9BACT|nr:response regulator transcription factor [Hymenobacter polaris]NML67237.1 response regulator transcription factor [Hymenobacter polaris]
MIRVFLVDDHAIMRDGLRAVLSAEPLLQVVGEAANGQELLGQLPAVPVDVVLLDMNMPVLDGLSTTRELLVSYPRLRILMLSMLTNEHTIAEVLAAGAHGYVLKNADKSEIVTAIQAVAAGKRFLCSDIGLGLLEKLVGLQGAAPTTGSNALTSFSHREREILQLVASGLTNQQIADKLFTSRRTVEAHRQSLLEKTGAKNTPALVKYAMEQGLLKS